MNYQTYANIMMSHEPSSIIINFIMNYPEFPWNSPWNSSNFPGIPLNRLAEQKLVGGFNPPEKYVNWDGYSQYMGK